jgi:hypothetical protein
MGLVACEGEGGNCLPEVVVRPSKAPVIAEVWEVVMRGEQNSIAAAFEKASESLAEFMEAEHLSGVIDGSLEASGTWAIPGESPERYLKILKEGDPVAVYPLKNAAE